MTQKHALSVEHSAEIAAQGRANRGGIGNGARAKKKGSWPETYKWLAMGTLVAYTSSGSQDVTWAKPQPQGSAAAVQFTGVYHNLLRRWADA